MKLNKLNKEWGLFPSNWWGGFSSEVDNVFVKLWETSTFATKGYPANVLYRDDTKEHVIEVALAGVAKDRIKISVKKDVDTVLTISVVEKETKEETKETVVYKRTSDKSWSYSYVLNNHDVDKISASLTDGLLTVVIPTVEVESKTKEIEVK